MEIHMQGLFSNHNCYFMLLDLKKMPGIRCSCAKYLVLIQNVSNRFCQCIHIYRFH